MSTAPSHRCYPLQLSDARVVGLVEGRLEMMDSSERVRMRLDLASGVWTPSDGHMQASRQSLEPGGTLVFTSGGGFVANESGVVFHAGVSRGQPMFDWPPPTWKVATERFPYLLGDHVGAAYKETWATPRGERSRLTLLSERGERIPLAELDGSVSTVALTEAVVAMKVILGEGAEQVTVQSRRDMGSLSFQGKLGRGLVAQGELAAIPVEGGLVVVRAKGGLAGALVPLGATAFDLYIAGPYVVAIADERVYVVDTTALTWSSTGFSPQGLNARLVRPAALSSTEPAEVIFARASTLLVNHPTLGRITITPGTSDPAIASGTFILLDEIEEKRPGIYHVLRWHPQGGKAMPTEKREDTVSFPPIVVVQPRPAQPSPVLPAITEGLARVGLHPSALLSRVGQLWVENAAFRTLLRSVSVLLDEAVEGDGEMLVPLASNGGGDACFLLARAGQADAPVIEWLHELDELEWCAPSFDAWFGKRLRDFPAETRTVLAEMIGPLAEQAIRTPLDGPPDWFAGLELPSLLED